jgi:hypothetical protein
MCKVTFLILLGLPLLHLKMGVEAQTRIHWTSCNEHWKPKSLWYRHVNKAQNVMTEPILQMETDKMILRHVFHKPFMARLPDRSEWERDVVPIGRGQLIWYTDGSKTNKALEPGCMAMA